MKIEYDNGIYWFVQGGFNIIGLDQHTGEVIYCDVPLDIKGLSERFLSFVYSKHQLQQVKQQ